MTGHPIPAQVRYRVDPADVPAEKAARRLHLTPQQFRELLPNLMLRGFPAADPDTGMFDLDEIDRWRRLRHGDKSGDRNELTDAPPNLQPLPQPEQLGKVERFLAAKERQTTGRRRHGGAA